MKLQGANNILVLGGGIIPKKDKELLETKGVYGDLGPGTALGNIIDYIKTKCEISGGRIELQVKIHGISSEIL